MLCRMHALDNAALSATMLRRMQECCAECVPGTMDMCHAGIAHLRLHVAQKLHVQAHLKYEEHGEKVFDCAQNREGATIVSASV